MEPLYLLFLAFSFLNLSAHAESGFKGQVVDDSGNAIPHVRIYIESLQKGNMKFDKAYGTLFARWIQKCDFFSGRNISAATNPDNIYNGSPVVAGQRVGTQWNYGPLGGFFLSLNGNYQLSKCLNLGAYVNNLLGKGNYEFIATAPTETTFGAEMKITLARD